jgi:uncharacterized protein (DUF1800 family)
MAFVYEQHFEHLLRRAGFGARPDELDAYRRMSFAEAIDTLLNYERVPDEVDGKIGAAGYAGVTTRGGGFQPNRVLVDAQQRWLFRMLHTNRPLQEKMTLFWHNHFATAYSKLAGILGQAEAVRYLAAKAADDSAGVRGQIEMLRDHALGNFQTLLVNVAQDVAMLYWLDGRTNVRARPQENFGREIMELFTLGVGHYTEADVYAAARVFTGWNLRRAPGAEPYWTFFYNASQHDPAAKIFTFAIYPDGSKTIPARSGAEGMQDGLDLIAALARSPQTADRLARKLYAFFVSEFGDADDDFVRRVTGAYFRSGYDMRAVLREVLWSPQFWDERSRFTRYAWPAEFVVRALKDIGWSGFSLNDARAALANMGQVLFDPPDVNGWETGPRWFSTGSMLARMNFAAALTGNQRFRIAEKARPYGATPPTLLAWALGSLRTAPLADGVTTDLLEYLEATGPWTGSPAQLAAKAPALVHLVAGTPEYQFI